MAAKKKTEAQEWMYTIIQRPLITEKSTMGSEHGQVSFEVSKDATKPMIKEAVETLFGVKVKAVNTIVAKGKSKRFRGKPIMKPTVKKAVISLEEGQTIDTGAGV